MPSRRAGTSGRSGRLLNLLGRQPSPSVITISDVWHFGSGARVMAAGPGGILWVMTPRRVELFACPAGFAHRRYFRQHTAGGSFSGSAGLACIHTTSFLLDPRAGLTADGLAALLVEATPAPVPRTRRP